MINLAGELPLEWQPKWEQMKIEAKEQGSKVGEHKLEGSSSGDKGADGVLAIGPHFRIAGPRFNQECPTL